MQIRKSIISLQIQSVSGGEADAEALRQHIIDSSNRLLSSIGGDNADVDSSRFGLPVLDKVYLFFYLQHVKYGVLGFFDR